MPIAIPQRPPLTLALYATAAGETDRFANVPGGASKLTFGFFGEVGGLLMQAWGLPEALVNNVRAIDRVLVTPPSQSPTAESPRLALCYLCARLGERLATGQISSLKRYDPFQDVGPDTFYLNEHLRNPMLRQLPGALASAEVQDALEQMMGGKAETA